MVEWTMRDMDIDEHARDGRRWDLKAQELKKLFIFLEYVVTQTWQEIESEGAGGHRRNHAHPVTDLSKQVQKRLREIGDGEEQIFRFRLDGSTRLWGFRSGNLFRVLWYDPEHQVYPVPQRHT